MVKILQSTIERLLYVMLLLLFIVSVAIYIKISRDDSQKFRVLKSNQGQIICIVKGFTDPANYANHGQFIDNCVKANP